jgi:hypothetical protein
VPHNFSKQKRTDILAVPELIYANVQVDADTLLIATSAAQEAGAKDTDGIIAGLRAAAERAREQAILSVMSARRSDPAIAELIARKLGLR